MSSLSFSSDSSQVVNGCGRDKCQRRHATVITTNSQSNSVTCVIVNDFKWCFVYTLYMARTLALWVCYMWMTVVGCLCALFCPSGTLGPQLQGTGFGSYPVLSWQWMEGGRGVKGSGLRRVIAALSSCCTLPLPRTASVVQCFHACVVLFPALGRGLFVFLCNTECEDWCVRRSTPQK